LLGTLAVALVPFVARGLASAASPRVKHMRRLGEVLEIYDKMDEGRAKDALDEVVHRHLVEVRARYLTPFRPEAPGKLGVAAITVGMLLYFAGLVGFSVVDGEKQSNLAVMFALMFVVGCLTMAFGAWRGIAKRKESLLKESRELLGVDEKGNWTPSPSSNATLGKSQGDEAACPEDVPGEGDEPRQAVGLDPAAATAGGLGEQAEDVEAAPAHRTLDPRTWVRRKSSRGDR